MSSSGLLHIIFATCLLSIILSLEEFIININLLVKQILTLKKGYVPVKAFWYNENRKNVCGIRIRELRKQRHLTQKQLAIKAQLAGYDFITETAIIKLELGTRFIPDYEVSIFAQLLDTTTDDLLQSKSCL